MIKGDDNLDKHKMGLQVKKARKMKNLTVEVLSAQIGLQSKSLSQIESGRRGTSIDKLIQLCNALETSPEFILAQQLNPNLTKLGTKYQALFDKIQLMSSTDLRRLDGFVDTLIKLNDD